MQRLGQLEPDTYSLLRLTLLGGEALPVDVARAWTRAAPNCKLYNSYGPTETTVTSTMHLWQEDSREVLAHETVPIGEPLPGLSAIIVDDQLNEVEPGRKGELLITGPQVSLGYWKDEITTAHRFVVPPGRTNTYYRTGDLVCRPADGGPISFLGRMDSQIQVKGYRVELGEIEAALRECASVSTAVAVPWPRSGNRVEGVLAFLPRQSDFDQFALIAALRSRLPQYMIPSEFRLVDEFPRNASGKIDRRALAESLDR